MSDLLTKLRASRQAISETENILISQDSEIKDLKIMLWRMIQKHGSTRFTDPIDEMTANRIQSTKFFINGDGCIETVHNPNQG
jgi:hypothetical protein